MSPVEGLTVECRIVDDNYLPNKVKDPFGIINGENRVILMKSLDSKNKI